MGNDEDGYTPPTKMDAENWFQNLVPNWMRKI